MSEQSAAQTEAFISDRASFEPDADSATESSVTGPSVTELSLTKTSADNNQTHAEPIEPSSPKAAKSKVSKSKAVKEKAAKTKAARANVAKTKTAKSKAVKSESAETKAAKQRPTKQRQIPAQRWQVFPAQRAQAKQISQATSLSPLLAQVLINRGIYTAEQAWAFLDPESQLLSPPLDEFPDLRKSLDMLVDAIAQQQPILICGDYDADGMTSTALLMRSLTYLGAQASYAIPSRMSEGYGINTRIVEDFHQAGGALVLTVDNGIAAYDPIARARELGLTIIITDHHEVPEKVPPANAILNPKLIGDASPYKGVAGVGVAYILAVCLAQRMDKVQDLTATLLGLFTLGTIADLAPLTGVNRRWVKRGLKVLPKSRIPGVQALIEVAGMAEEKALKPEAIGFRLGPRINAVGRIADPQIVIDLLTTDDIGVALQRAMQCEEANKLRQQMCQLIEMQAVEWVESQQEKGLLNLNKSRVLVVVQPEWHHGVIGIVASRLVERYGVPVFIGTYEDEDKKEIRGSARSIPEFNVFEALQFCDDLLGRYGGHRAAGGFSFEASKLRQVKSRLSTFACKHLQPEHLKPLVTVDVQAQLEDVDLDLFNQIDRIHPCGIENPSPIFWTANAAVVEQRVIGKEGAHLKLTVAHTAPGGGETVVMKAIAWRWGSYYPLPRNLDIAYKIRLNEWKGQSNVELEIVGVRATADSEHEPFEENEQPWSTQPLPINSTTAVKESFARESLKPVSTAKTTAQAAKEIAKTLKQELAEPKAAPLSKDSSVEKVVPEVSRDSVGDEPAAETSSPEISLPDTSSPDTSSPTTLSSNSSSSDRETPQAPESATYVEFYHNKRRYKGSLDGSKDGSGKRLSIENANGDILLVQMSDRKGFLYRPEQAPQPVDIADAKYFNLVRAGLSAIEVKQKNQMLIHKDELIEEKDELLTEKDRQISTLKAQMSLLEEKLTQLSAEQQQQFAELEAARQAQENSIQGQEAHIEQLQVQVIQPVSAAPSLTTTDIKQQVRDAIGDNVWFCLQPASQKDFQAAYKNYQMASSGGPDAHIDDYSEAGVRLSSAVEREVLYPFFADLSSFLRSQQVTSIGSLPLSVTQQPTEQTLSMIPPLIADQWRSFPPGQLSVRSLPEEGAKIVQVKAQGRVSASDRALITQFLGQWEHPMASCFSTKGRQAASSLDQISKLRNIAIHSESFLYLWQYDLLHQLIAGKGGKGGLFRQIFSV